MYCNLKTKCTELFGKSQDYVGPFRTFDDPYVRINKKNGYYELVIENK